MLQHSWSSLPNLGHGAKQPWGLADHGWSRWGGMRGRFAAPGVPWLGHEVRGLQPARGRGPSAETGWGAGRGTQCGEAMRGEQGQGHPTVGRAGWSRHTQNPPGWEPLGSQPPQLSRAPWCTRGRGAAVAVSQWGQRQLWLLLAPRVPLLCRALPSTLHLPGPGGPCLQQPVRGQPGREGAGWAGRRGGSGVCSAHAGVAAPAAGREAPRPAGPVLLGGSSLPRRSHPGAAGTPRHYAPERLPALPGQGRGGGGQSRLAWLGEDGDKSQAGQVGTGMAGSHRQPRPWPSSAGGG